MLMETAEVLRKIRAMCKKADGCSVCVLDRLFCNIVPDHWTDEDIKKMTEAIDNHKEDKK